MTWATPVAKANGPRGVPGGKRARAGQPDVAGLLALAHVGAAPASQRAHHGVDDRGRGAQRGQAGQRAAAPGVAARGGEHRGRGERQPPVVGRGGEPGHGPVDRRARASARSPRRRRGRGARRPPSTSAGGAGRGRLARSHCSRHADGMARSRLAAVAALVCGLVALSVGVDLAFSDFPDGLVQPLLLVAAAAAAWWGLLRRGPRRALGLGARVPGPRDGAGGRGGGRPARRGLWSGSRRSRSGVAASRRAFAKRGDLPPAEAPRRRRAADEPEVRRGQGRALLAGRRGAGPRHRGRGDEPGRRPERAGRRGGGARRRCAGDGGRGRVAGDRGRPGGRARAAVRVHPGRHAQPPGAGPGRRPQRRGGRARRVRGRRRDRGRPGRGQRPRVREQRLARRVRRGGPAGGLPRRQGAHAARHRSRRARPGGPGAGAQLDRRLDRRDRDQPGDAGLQRALPARPRGGLGHPADPPGRAARGGGVRDRAQPPPAPALAGVGHPGVRGAGRRAGVRGDRRRGRPARAAAALPQPARGAAGQGGPAAPGRLALGGHAQEHGRRRARPW